MAVDGDRERKQRKIAEVAERMRAREEAFRRDCGQRLAAAVSAPTGASMSVEEALVTMRAFDDRGEDSQD